eukprot:227648-Amphidinium_carterae.1
MPWHVQHSQDTGTLKWWCGKMTPRASRWLVMNCHHLCKQVQNARTYTHIKKNDRNMGICMHQKAALQLVSIRNDVPFDCKAPCLDKTVLLEKIPPTQLVDTH